MSASVYSPKKVSSIREMLENAKNTAGDTVAYRYKIKRHELKDVTYNEVYEASMNLGAGLCSLGLGSSHIACVAKNSYRWIVSFLTVLQGAGVFVPLDGELPAKDLVHVLNDCDSEAVFFDRETAGFFKEHADELPRIKYFISLDKKVEGERFVTFDELVDAGKNNGRDEFLALKSDPEALKLLVYTSGTTGAAKGVMLSEHNLVSCIYYATFRIKRMPQVGMSVLPYYHTYESVCNLLLSLNYHSTLCINDSLLRVKENIQLFKPEYMFLVPIFAETLYSTVMRTMKKSGKLKKFEFGVKISALLRKLGIDVRRRIFSEIIDGFGGNLRFIVCGGAAIRPELARFYDDVGITFIGGYGITECSPLVSCNATDDTTSDTAGYVLDCLESRIDDPDEDGIGEICVKGDVVMSGYYKKPELTKEVLIDGWFHTGDYGKFTKERRLKITGRKKYMIVLANGKNIYPEEIESYIMNIDYIDEVVVAAVKNEYGMEIGLSAEIYSANPIDSEQVRLDISEQLKELPAYKHIDKIIIREKPFKKTNTRKIRR